MIGIIGAMDVEVEALRNAAREKTEEVISGVTYIKGKIAGKDCVIAQCGIGKVNAAVCTQTMCLKYQPEAIVNCGIGGALAHGMDIGDIVIAKSVVQHDMDTTDFGDAPGLLNIGTESMVEIPCDLILTEQLKQACRELKLSRVLSGCVATGDRFISKKESRMHIHESFGAVACEMEGGAIGQVCRLNGTAFAVLRTVSDSIDKNTAVDFFTFKQHAAKIATDVITRFFELYGQ